MNNRRERLSPFLIVVLLGGSVLVALIAAFQRESQQDDYFSGEPASELTVSYLEAWLRLQPDSTQRLVLLGEQYLKLNRREQALALAEHMEQLDSTDDGMKKQALYLRVHVAQQLAYEVTEHDSQRTPRLQTLRDELRGTLDYAWSIGLQTEFATMAAQAGAYDVALQYYRQLAQADSAQALQWHQLAADLAFARQEYEAAADSLFAAAALSTSVPQERGYFLQALAVLESGDQAALACTLAEQHIGRLENDRQVVIRLLSLARMANRPDLVNKYAQKLAGLLELSAHQPTLMFGPAMFMADLADSVLAVPARWLAIAVRQVRGSAGYEFLAASRGLLGRPNGIAGVSLAIETADVAEPVTTASTAVVGNGDYELLYQVYVENGSLAKAMEIANKALAKGLPAEVWNPRLAQVAEWNGQPGLALQAWSRHAVATDSAVSWGHVRRLSLGLNDDARYLQALQFDIRNTPNNADLYDELVLAYERLGEPERAMQFLQGQAAGSRSTVLLERYALLAERAGHDDKAEQLYQRLVQIDQAGKAIHLTAVARLKYKQGQDEAALQLLREQAGHVGETSETAGFWRLYAELARVLQSSADADRAYRSLLASGEATPADLAGMTYFYVHSPMDAARIADAHLQQEMNSKAALDATLLNYAELRAWNRISDIIGKLTREQQDNLVSSASSLLVRGRYLLHQRQWTEAVDSFRQAVNVAPANDDVKVSYLWALVEYGSDAELAQRLHEWRKLLRLNSGYREVFAAGYLRLGKTRRAVQLLRMQPEEVQKDPLWVMALADAEQQNGNDQLALLLYRQAWQGLHAKLAATPQDTDGILPPVPADQQLEWWQARGVLATRLVNAERASMALNQLFMQDMRLSAPQIRYQSRLGNIKGLDSTTTITAETAPEAPVPATFYAGLGVFMEREAYERARMLLAHPAIADLPGNADYEMSLALAEEDATTAGELLERRKGRIAYYNQAAALLVNQRTSELESLLFAGLDATPANDAMHEDLAEVLWPDKSAVGVSLQLGRAEALDTDALDVFARLKLTNRYGITARSITRRQNIRRNQDIAWVPSTDHEQELSIHDRTSEHDFTLSLGQRSGFKSFATGRIFAQVNRQGTWVPSATLGWRQYTSLSPYLQVAGYKNMLDLEMAWQPENSRWFASANVELARFYSQKHDEIAKGTEFNQELGYRIYHAYPDWNVRLVAGQGTYSASGKDKLHPALTRLNPDQTAPSNRELVPENFRRYGIMTGFGNSDFTTRKSAWRPFVDIGYIHDNKNGNGPVASAGVGGPVLGGDHLVLQYLHEATGTSNRQRTNQVLVSYYINF